MLAGSPLVEKNRIIYRIIYRIIDINYGVGIKAVFCDVMIH